VDVCKKEACDILLLTKFPSKKFLAKVLTVKICSFILPAREGAICKRKGSPFTAVAADSLSAFNDITTAQRKFSLLGAEERADKILISHCTKPGAN
jgi:hypothetical protein